MPIQMKPGEKAFFVASTGSGKSFLMRAMLLGAKYVIVLDAKHEWSWSDTGRSKYDDVYVSLDDLVKRWTGPGPAIYRPDVLELRDGCNEFFHYAWDKKTVHINVDELLDICPKGEPSYFLEKGLKQGRSRGLTIWSGTQRPFGIPIELMSESKHFFVGNLLMPHDKKRMADLVHPDLAKMVIPPFQFYYGGPGKRELEPINAESISVRRK